MLKLDKLPLLILIIFMFNGIILLKEYYALEDIEYVFAEASRNSERLSLIINSIILIFIALMGLKRIYNRENLRNAFRILVTIFALNHLFHFFYGIMYFYFQSWDIASIENVHGYITLISIILFPIILWKVNKLNKVFYFGIILHLFNVSFYISETFYKRFTLPDPDYIHKTGMVIMAVLLFLVLFKEFKERSKKLVRKKD